jgi:hypothetical protein
MSLITRFKGVSRVQYIYTPIEHDMQGGWSIPNIIDHSESRAFHKTNTLVLLHTNQGIFIALKPLCFLAWFGSKRVEQEQDLIELFTMLFKSLFKGA